MTAIEWLKISFMISVPCACLLVETEQSAKLTMIDVKFHREWLGEPSLWQRLKYLLQNLVKYGDREVLVLPVILWLIPVEWYRFLAVCIAMAIRGTQIGWIVALGGMVIDGAGFMLLLAMLIKRLLKALGLMAAPMNVVVKS